MQFRKDVNGLRAIAVIAVVLFHFKPSWAPGGFVGVDVFFVISGFLMTSIILKGLESKNFSILLFYVSRANRIIPALSVLCFVVAVFCWFYLVPGNYKDLGKHIASSIGFVSNFVYWSESGYFDTSSHEKWLLHTWSLSVEWQFYIVYPLFLVAMYRFMKITTIRKVIVLGVVIGFALCVILTYKWPNASYYLLPARIWEMMLGGVAYLYPSNLKESHKKLLHWLGLLLIVSSLFFISKNNLWPGYLSLFPVLGAFMLIQAQRGDGFISSNVLFQKLGSWSYSIYLWHWPFVVFSYYFSLPQYYAVIGGTASILFGYLSYKYVEKAKFRRNFYSILSLAKFIPVHMVIFIGILGGVLFVTKGVPIKLRMSDKVLAINEGIKNSPYRRECHASILKKIEPKEACTYFSDNVTWATIGDSHLVELTYALAEDIKSKKQGVKHYSFSSCIPSYGQSEDFSKCASWTNEAVKDLISNKKIQNVIVMYRYSHSLFGDNMATYPNLPPVISKDDIKRKNIIKSLDDLVRVLAQHKQNVYVFKPVPELGRSVSSLLGGQHISGGDIQNVVGVSKDYYLKRNESILKYFSNVDYPENVSIIDPAEVYCDKNFCWAIKGGVPLYFDEDHPSVVGSAKLVELLKNQIE